MDVKSSIAEVLLVVAATAFSLHGQRPVAGAPAVATTPTTAAVAVATDQGPSNNSEGDGPRSGAEPSIRVYAGNDACKTCHPGIWRTFLNNPHFKSLASGKEPPERTGCEGCHGPMKAHLTAGGGKETVPFAFTIMKSQEIISRCLTCHAKDMNRANIRRSEHTQHDVACTECHSNHHPATVKNLLAKSQPDACYQCHTDIRAQFAMPSKHPVNEGFMVCTDCHNPHGGFTPTFGMGQTSKMLNQSHGSDQPCLKCHVEKRGPFVFEHETGQEDGCISCHRPHGSPNAKLLTRTAVAQLCLECHTGNGDFGVRSNRGITYPDHATHSMTDPHYQRCTGCHVAIHGSNVHNRFLR